MPRYKCKNKECSLYGIEKANDSRIKVIDGAVIDSGDVCPECGKHRKSIVEKGFTTTMLGSANICKK